MRHAHPIVIQPVLHWSHDASELFSLCCLPLQLCFSSSLPTSPPTSPPAQPLPEVSASPDFVPLCCWHAAPEAGRRSQTRLRIYLAQPPHVVIATPHPHLPVPMRNNKNACNSAIFSCSWDACKLGKASGSFPTACQTQPAHTCDLG